MQEPGKIGLFGGLALRAGISTTAKSCNASRRLVRTPFGSCWRMPTSVRWSPGSAAMGIFGERAV